MKIRYFAWMPVISVIAAACGGGDGASNDSNAATPASPGGTATEHVSSVTASEKTTASTGVKTWELGFGDKGYHAIGRDGEGRQLVAFRASDVASCNQKKGTLVPFESKELPGNGREVSLGCSTDAPGRAVDAATQLIWQSLSSDTGPQREQLAQYSPNEAPTCEPKTNLLCCGHVTLWCEDQWPNQNWECETSGWYPCGTCWVFTPWCVEP